MSKNNRKYIYLKHGFTLVEMLVIAPIVILVIGVFIGAIINMTGDVLANRAANALSYSVQDVLNRIEQDVKTSGGYLATNNFTPISPQGYSDNTTKFENSDLTTGTALILNTFTTTKNPLNSDRKIVYIRNNPNACGSSAEYLNSTLMMNTVYFVKTVSDISTLWRRIIAPNNYTTIGCSAPWQQPSCALGIPGTMCVTQDTKLLEGVQTSSFQIEYYKSDNTPVPDASNSALADSVRDGAIQSTCLANCSAKITITATQTVAGRDISQTGTIRVTSPNNNFTYQ